MAKLTVLIPCKDERSQILDCIASVEVIADEILVADSGSTDGTLDLVRTIPRCRIIEREFVNYADFKNWAIPQAKNEWILVVDADERVTPALANEIKDLLAEEPPKDAYELQRENYFLGRHINHCGWNRSYVRRLFRKSLCRYGECRVHEELNVTTGRIGHLTAKLVHYTCLDFDAFVRKQVKYSLFAAEDRFDRGGRITYLKVLVHPPLRFLQLYLGRGGILDGFAGLVLCLLLSFCAFLKDAKMWTLAARPHLFYGSPAPRRHERARKNSRSRRVELVPSARNDHELPSRKAA